MVEFLAHSYNEEWVNPHYYPLDVRDKEWVKDVFPTGSFLICKPQVVDTDKDYVLRVDDLADADVKLIALGYSSSIHDNLEYDIQEDGLFACYRKGDINLIVTDSADFYKKWVDASLLAQKLVLNNKNDRITLFKYVLYGDLE